jgi:hypothetical protein
VFAALLGLAWYLQTRPITDESQLTPTAVQNKLFNFDTSSVVSVRITGPGGRVFYSTRGADGVWELVEPANPEPIDSALVESNMTQLFNALTLTQLEVPPALEAIGLVSPEYLIEIQLSNGSRHQVEVGSQTPTGSGYYIRFDNTSLVVVNKFTLDSALDMVTNLPLLPTPTLEPTITPEEIEISATPDNSATNSATPTP